MTCVPHDGHATDGSRTLEWSRACFSAIDRRWYDDAISPQPSSVRPRSATRI